MNFTCKQHYIHTLTLLHVAAFKATSSESSDNFGNMVKIFLSICKYQIKE
jgi:hypothetical protein